MTQDGPGLTPELAVGYLRELSADIREAVGADAGRSSRRRRPSWPPRPPGCSPAAPDAAEIEVAGTGGVIRRGARGATTPSSRSAGATPCPP